MFSYVCMYVHSHLQHFVKRINKHRCSGIAILMIYQRASLHLNLMSSGPRALSYVSGYFSHLPRWLKNWTLSLFYGTKLKMPLVIALVTDETYIWVLSCAIPAPVHALSACWLLGPLDYWVWNLIWWGFPGGSEVENLPASSGDRGSTSGLGKILWRR